VRLNADCVDVERDHTWTQSTQRVARDFDGTLQMAPAFKIFNSSLTLLMWSFLPAYSTSTESKQNHANFENLRKFENKIETIQSFAIYKFDLS
jgi:hypothetical protein